MNLGRFFDKIIEYSFYLLFFLVPLILTPVNYELFEFNKMILTYLITIIIIGAWLGKLITEGKIQVKKTPLDIPIFLYFISSLLSTIFSIDIHTSLWGYYSRFHGGLASTICYIVLYYAFVSNLDQKKTFYSIYALLSSAFLVTFYGILERFGIDAKYWVQDVQNRIFSTLGQPNWLGAFIDALIFIPLSLALKAKTNYQKYLSYFVFITFLFCLIFTNSKSALLAFWLGLTVFTILILKNQKPVWKKLKVIWIISLIIYLILGQKSYHYIKKAPLWLSIFSQKPITAPPAAEKDQEILAPFISESSEIRKVVWQGAIKIWQNYPIFGSGLETFAYSYYNFRPAQHNLLSEWDFLYNKAHNEFLNILACQGALGIITYLFFTLSFLWQSLNINKRKNNQDKDSQTLIISLTTGFITILITNFFGFSVVIIGILFFLIPAFTFNLNSFSDQKSRNINLNLKSWFLKDLLFILNISLTLYSGYLIVNIWRADYHYNQGENYYKSDYLITGFEQLQKAIQLSPNQALYHSKLSELSAKLALAYQQTNASESAEIISQLTALSEQESNTAIQLNPVHLNFYKSQAKTFIYLGYLNPEYNDKAEKALETAILLAPTDAKLFYNLGLLYQQQNKLEKAQQVWEKAIDLKPNYRTAYIDLSKLYLETEQYHQAKDKLEYVLEKINPNDKLAEKMLKDIKNKQ